MTAIITHLVAAAFGYALCWFMGKVFARSSTASTIRDKVSRKKER